MDHSEDVERLFSWIKAPMVHYREFSPQVAIAEAVATWPIVHMAAVQTGITSADDAVPHGDFLAHQRLAKDRMGMPALAAQAIHDAPLSGMSSIPEANAPHALPSSDRLVAALGQRVQAANAERAEAATRPFEPSLPEPPPFVPTSLPPALPPATPASVAPPPAFAAATPAPPPARVEPRHEIEEPVMAGFDDTPAAAPAAPRGMPLHEERRLLEPPAPVASPAANYAAADRGALFSGEYRGREREARPSNPVADRQDRSLDAVFNRLSGARDRLPDPRARGRTSPGLGAVFGRLR